jgi:cell division protein FtsW
MRRALVRGRTVVGALQDGGATRLIVDRGLLFAVVGLIAAGVVMMSSASFGIADRQLDQPLYFLGRHIAYLSIGVMLGGLVLYTPLAFWEKTGWIWLLSGVLLLMLVLVPGVGREVNGAVRWLSFGVFNVQPSEIAKFSVVIYLSGYLVRRRDEVRQAVSGFVKPMALLALLCMLLLAEPDFGSSAVMMATAMGMMFLGGVRLWQFGVLLLFVAIALVLLALSSPYRLERITAFLDPWADPFASGFQLTQALIAFGRGEWFGVGLGGSVQKLFYLPEAHTDFLLAVIAEELGLVGTVAVIGLFSYVVLRAFRIGRDAEKSGNPFGGFLAYGLGLWLAIQAITNIGVNMGLLPTKGLTLPFMSYGGSSLVVMCIVVALLLRIAYETRRLGIRGG